MIVSKKYGFIFLKTRKTAGTSIEIALSRATARDDIITRISADDEILRQKWGGVVPRTTRTRSVARLSSAMCEQGGFVSSSVARCGVPAIDSQ